MKASAKLAITLLAYSVIGTVIGIAASLPYQFGGVGDPARVSEEFVVKGTAISPPLVAFVIPTLGEVMGAGAFSGPAYVFVVVWNLIGAAIILGMVVFGAREAFRRSQTP